MRPLGNVMEVISTAFVPLRCGVEVFGHGETLRFRVFDDFHSDLLRTQHPLSELQDDRALRGAIHAARLQISEHGYRLSAWQLPPA